MDKIITHPQSKQYDEGWERIFGKKPKQVFKACVVCGSRFGVKTTQIRLENGLGGRLAGYPKPLLCAHCRKRYENNREYFIDDLLSR